MTYSRTGGRRMRGGKSPFIPPNKNKRERPTRSIESIGVPIVVAIGLASVSPEYLLGKNWETQFINNLHSGGSGTPDNAFWVAAVYYKERYGDFPPKPI